MTSTTHSPTVVSAPGKVLLAGGYLVLDRLYSGLVVATSSRFYTAAQHILPSHQSTSTSQAEIVVRAGQFPSDQSTWIYSFSFDPATNSLSLEQTNADAGRNKFIEITLAKILQLAYEVIGRDVGVEKAGPELISRLRGDTGAVLVVVLADNDFYSQREQLSQASLPLRISFLDQLTPFCPLPRPIGQTNKTGLGSSAALVTSLVAAVLSHLAIVDLTGSSFKGTDRDLVHALAQVAHCLAQGKVGSGFDVASAVYGTHIYRRFTPSIIEPLMAAPPTTVSTDGRLLGALDASVWDQGADSFRLPKGIRLMLADVDAGTDTPSFVGKVLAWRKANPEAALDLWTRLDEANNALGVALANLALRESDPDYTSSLASASQSTISSLDAAVPIYSLLLHTQHAIITIRQLLRDMSTASAVPIEPAEQTRLLDACMACPGVIGGGVPGAGGYDALFLLVVDAPGPVAAVEEVWEGWAEMSVCPLSARQSDGGLQLETVDGVRGLAAALDRAA